MTFQTITFAHQFSEQIARFLWKNERMSDSLKKTSYLLIRSYLLSNLSDSLISFRGNERITHVFGKKWAIRSENRWANSQPCWTLVSPLPLENLYNVYSKFFHKVSENLLNIILWRRCVERGWSTADPPFHKNWGFWKPQSSEKRDPNCTTPFRCFRCLTKEYWIS